MILDQWEDIKLYKGKMGFAEIRGGSPYVTEELCVTFNELNRNGETYVNEIKEIVEMGKLVFFTEMKDSELAGTLVKF